MGCFVVAKFLLTARRAVPLPLVLVTLVLWCRAWHVSDQQTICFACVSSLFNESFETN